MDGTPSMPLPVALAVNRHGDLLPLLRGEPALNMPPWVVHRLVPVGERLLRLAEEPDAPAAADLAFGRELARRVVRAAAAAPGEEAQVMPGAGELAELLAVTPAMRGRPALGEEGLERAWRRVAGALADALRASDDREELLRRHGADPELGRLYFHLAERPEAADGRPFALLVTHGRSRGAHGRVQHAPLATAWAELADDPARQRRLLAPLRRACERNATLRDIVARREVFHPVAWTAAQAYALLSALGDLEACGIRVRVPDWWRAGRPALQVRVELGAEEPTLGLDALLDFKLGYFVGDDEISAEEWRALTRGAAGLHRLHGRWIELDPRRHAEALQHWDSVEAAAARGQVGFVEGMRLLAGMPRGALGEAAPVGWTVVRPGPWLARTLADLQDPRGSVEADPGDALRGEMRPYQREGVGWLWLLVRLGLGGCLADDMGLGKTIQVIALLLVLRKHRRPGPHLVVLPASLLGNWRAELARFAPGLRVAVAHRSAGDVDAPPAGEVDVVLTTYATLLRLEWVQEQQWGLVVLDEAQAIKNAEARQTRAVKALRARHRLTLTGTPVENSLADLWSLFDFTSPGLLGGAGEFKAFVRRLGSDRAGLEPLRRLVRPYILRRVKTDRRIIADLPDKTELRVYCGLTRVQAALYATAVESLAREAAAAVGMARRGLILAYLTRFKQICNHPSHYSGDGRYVPGDSAKFLRLQELCATITEAGERALVFTQFREMCEPLAELLAGSFGRPGLVLHGGTPVERRAAIVEQFQRDDGPPFMVLSLRAGGTGLNLTAAAHVIHFDRWWNPAVENQATDRAYRIGQHRNVLVHKFVCRGTLEDRIDAMIDAKQGLADGVLADDGEHRLTELSTDELLRVVALDLRAALSED